jgi:hypothetical protein
MGYIVALPKQLSGISFRGSEMVMTLIGYTHKGFVNKCRSAFQGTLNVIYIYIGYLEGCL